MIKSITLTNGKTIELMEKEIEARGREITKLKAQLGDAVETLRILQTQEELGYRLNSLVDETLAKLTEEKEG